MIVWSDVLKTMLNIWLHWRQGNFLPAERLSASQDFLRRTELDGQGTGILSLDLCAVGEGRYLTYPG
jgi:hypothetical protein